MAPKTQTAAAKADATAKEAVAPPAEQTPPAAVQAAASPPADEPKMDPAKVEMLGTFDRLTELREEFHQLLDKFGNPDGREVAQAKINLDQAFMWAGVRFGG